MARKLHIPHADFPYHVSARSHGGSWFRIPPDEVWRIMTRNLHFLTFAFDVKIHSFVLMGNHFHLLISTPKANLSEAMNYLLRETAKDINRAAGTCNQVYGGRYCRSLITNSIYYSSAYKYVYRNPVTVGLSKTCEEYPYSTLRGILGLSKLPVPVAADPFIFDSCPEKTLQWLNTSPSTINY
ncbi:MAG: hypothetical protein EOP09_03825, partial [Proteobacteria bacterium]